MTATLEGGEWSATRPGRTLPPGKKPVPILQEVGWAPGPVWRGRKSRPHRDSIPDLPAHSSVAIPTELPGPHLYIVAELRKRGAIPPRIIVWCIGTGKLEVLRHDVNEYRSVPAYTRSSTRVEIFVPTLKAMAATFVFYWRNCDIWESADGTAIRATVTIKAAWHILNISYAQPPTRLLWLTKHNSRSISQRSRTTPVISLCKKVCTLSTCSEAIFPFRIRPKLLPMPRKHKRRKTAALDPRSIWRLFAVLPRRNRMFTVVSRARNTQMFKEVSCYNTKEFTRLPTTELPLWKLAFA